MNFEGKIALVTGASRGIGRAIAETLAARGAKVIGTATSENGAQAISDYLGANGKGLMLNVTDPASIESVLEKIRAEFGEVDILVNNAGIFAQRSEWNKNSLLETRAEEWENVMRTNTGALFFNMQHAVRYMLANGIKGNILNITSVAGEEPVYGAYGASKIASSGLTRGWGKQFASDGIVINGIAPGPVATEMNDWHEGDSMEHSRIPFGRFASIDEIGKLAMYLLSTDAEMICGETVIMDGAYSIR